VVRSNRSIRSVRRCSALRPRMVFAASRISLSPRATISVCSATGRVATSAAAVTDTSPRLYCLDKLGSAMVANFGGALYASLAYIQQLRRPCLGGFANWRMLIIAALERCQLRGHHGALGFAQVPPMQIERDHIGDGVAALVAGEDRLDASGLAGTIAIAEGQRR
jgi:hypothetical protein